MEVVALGRAQIIRKMAGLLWLLLIGGFAAFAVVATALIVLLEGNLRAGLVIPVRVPVYRERDRPRRALRRIRPGREVARCEPAHRPQEGEGRGAVRGAPDRLARDHPAREHDDQLPAPARRPAVRRAEEVSDLDGRVRSRGPRSPARGVRCSIKYLRS